MTGRFLYLYLLFGAVISLIIAEELFADSGQTLTSYYTVPNGSYDTLRLYPHSSDSDPPGTCAVGTLYINYSNLPRYCANVAGVATWSTISDIWTQSGHNIYLTDTNPNLKVGIGSKTPEFKLSLLNDGMIIAQGMFGSGKILPDLMLAGASEFLWYPRKAAIRAGKVNSHEWSDEDIGNYSVALGQGLTARGDFSVSAGSGHFVTGNYAITLGGLQNNANADYAAVIGGNLNIAAGQYSIVTGGTLNQANADYTVTAGGNTNRADMNFSIVAGGFNNQIYSPYSNINGGKDNLIQIPSNNVGFATIGGGLANNNYGNFSTIMGGASNFTWLDDASIGGGQNNIAGNYSPSTGTGSRVSGGKNNTAAKNYSTIGAGENNAAQAVSSTVCSGYNNTVSGNYSVIAGGSNNNISGQFSMIMGGENNSVSGDYSWAGGRNMNVTGNHTFAWGNSDNPVNITRSDVFVLVPGTISGLPSNPKLGIRTLIPSAVMEINGNGSTDHYFNIKKTTTGDIFLIKNNGVVRIGRTVTDNNSHVLQIGMDGTNGNGAYLTVDGQWTNASSRKKKERIKPLISLDAEQTLDLLTPVTFNYIVLPGQKSAGFIAEDVPDLVAMKDRDKLSTMDIVAVLTKVAQDQDQTIENQNKRIQNLRSMVRELKEKLGE